MGILDTCSGRTDASDRVPDSQEMEVNSEARQLVQV